MTDAAQPVPIPYAEVQRMRDDLSFRYITHGSDGQGRMFSIESFVSKSTGKIYDCASIPGEETRCAEIPPNRTP